MLGAPEARSHLLLNRNHSSDSDRNIESIYAFVCAYAIHLNVSATLELN